MKGPWRLGAVCLTLLASDAGLQRLAAVETPGTLAAPRAVERFASFLQRRPDGAYVNWFEGHAGILGRATKYQDLKLKPFILEAEQMALTQGRTKLMDYFRTISIDGARRLGDDPVVFGKVRDLLDRTPPGAREVVLPYRIKVPIRLALFGPRGIMGAVLDQAGAVGPAGESAPEGQPATDVTTGLVVDASSVAELSPALLPKIVDQAGRVVYGLETADPRQALLRGLAVYALRVEVRETRPAPQVLNKREGDRPVRVKAIGAAGPGKVWAVVSVADADRILELAAASPFLKNCSVLILSSPTGLMAAPPVAPPGRPWTPATKAPRKDL